MERRHRAVFPSVAEGRLRPFMVMGVINLTPDSFYSGSRCSGQEEAVALAGKMVSEGADILDVGAESSRPGAEPVSEKEELKRLLPVISELAERFDVPLSIDTWKPGVAEKALEAGARIINDVTGLSRHSGMAEVVAGHDAGLVAMHMRGTPGTMQENPVYADVVGEIADFLRGAVEKAESAGVNPGSIAIDPGIGFGKTLEHNLTILQRLGYFSGLGKPVLLGASRKSFLGKILDLPEEERLEGSLSAAVIGRAKGASIFRTHDVRETVRALRVADAILESGKVS